MAGATRQQASAGRKPFDRKFGDDRIATLPTEPGVYLFRDATERVLYVGKAKNLRRRLQSYRNATRKRAHRKMRTLVREASSLEVRPLGSEREALLTENALIQSLRPPFNVDGAYAFLYPAVGLRTAGRQTLLAFCTDPEQWAPLQLRWYGAFRSRPRALAGFEALYALLCRLGHREPRTHLPERPALRGCRLVGVRQLPPALLPALEAFLQGRDPALLSSLSTALLGKPRALREAEQVQAELQAARAFFDADCARLRSALQALGRDDDYVPQDERDALFIRART